jgi:ATPase subunit of ABC transporter with duplicated ATPase domains
VLLTGASGTGQSTILRAITGQPTPGVVAHLAGADAASIDSAALAALDDTVAALPAGLDTPVGPGGAYLSGGQRRRLSVAQGVLRHPHVLLLDEPTEGLDTPTAARLLAGVRTFDPSAALVIALHDRQAPLVPWTPTGRLELAPTEPWRALG